MAINRYDRPGVYDFRMEHYIPQEFVPNFEAWDSVLGTLQAEKNVVDQFASLVPDYLQQYDDTAHASYLEENEQMIEGITNMYASGNINQARQAQADFIRKIRRDYQPGGKATKFVNRKKSFAESVNQINELYKDAPPYMRQRGLEYLTKSIRANDLDQSIAVPGNIGAYLDIMTDLSNDLKGWEEDGDVFVEKKGGYFWKYKNRYVTSSEMNRAISKILQQPKYAQQLEAEAWLVRKGIDDETLGQSFQQELASQEAKMIAEIDNMSTIDFQKKALKAGYDIGSTVPDGDEGPKTRAAREQIKQEIRDKISQTEFNPDSYAMQIAASKYIEPLVAKHSFLDTDLTLQLDSYGLLQAKARMARNMFDIMSRQMPQANEFYHHGPAIETSVENVAGQMQEAAEAKANSNRMINDLLSKAGMDDIVDSENLAYTLNAFKTTNDFEQFKEQVNAGLPNNKRYTDDELQRMHEFYGESDSQAALNEALSIKHNADRSHAMLNNFTDQIQSKFNASQAGNKFWSDAFSEVKSTINFSEGIPFAAVSGFKPTEEEQAILDEVSELESGEEFREYYLNNPESRRLINMYSKSTSTKSLPQRYNESLTEYANENPQALGDIAPVVATTDKDSPLYGASKLMTDAFKNNGISAFAPLDGKGNLKFIGPNGKEVDFDKLHDLKTLSVTPAVSNNQSVVLINVEAKKGNKNKKERFYAYAIPNARQGDVTLTNAGAALYANTYDDGNNPKTGDNAELARTFGALMYFNGNNGKDFEDSVLSQISPNERTNIQVSNLKVSPQGELVPASGNTLVGEATRVANVPMNNGQYVNMYVTENSVGKPVWKLTTSLPNGQEVGIFEENGNSLRNYDSYEAAKEGMAKIFTKLTIEQDGVDKYKTKGQSEFTNESMNIINMFGINPLIDYTDE